MDRLSGTVQWLHDATGFGFIARAGGLDVSVHSSAIGSEGFASPQEGGPVAFEIVQGDEGPQAADVSRAG